MLQNSDTSVRYSASSDPGIAAMDFTGSLQNTPFSLGFSVQQQRCEPATKFFQTQTMPAVTGPWLRSSGYLS
jgi:hypothetical protein